MANPQTNWTFSLVDDITSNLKKMVAGFDVFGRKGEKANDKVIKSISDLEKELVDLNAKKKKSFNTDEVLKFNKSIEKTQAEIEKLNSLGKKTEKSFSFLSDPNNAMNVNAIGDSFSTLADSLKFGDDIGKLENSINNFAKGTPEELEKLTKSAFKISEVFIQDSDEIVRAANSLTQNLGGTFAENLKLIKKGFTQGADANKNFLDQLREYPSVFNGLKISGEQMIAIITQANRAGVYDDKAIDSIKEASLSLADLNKEQKGILTSMGIGVADFQKQIASGDIINPLKTVSKQLKGLDKAAQTKAIGKLFKGVGEDAKGVILKFHEFEDTLDKVSDKTTDWQKTKDEVASNMADMKFSIFSATKEWLPFIQFSASGLGTITQLTPAVATLGKGMSSIVKGTVKFVAAVIGGLVPALGTATTAQWSFNAAADANPVGAIVVAVVALVAIIAVLVVYWEDLVKWFNELPGALKIVIGLFSLLIIPIIAIVRIIRVFIDNWEAIVETVKKTPAVFESVFNKIKNSIIGFISTAKGLFRSLFDFIWEHHPFKAILDSIDSLFPNLKIKVFEIWQMISDELITPVKEALSSVFDWLFTSNKSEKKTEKKKKEESKKKKDEEEKKKITTSSLGLDLTGSSSAKTGNANANITSVPEKAKTINMTLNITNNFNAGESLTAMRRKVKEVVEQALVDASRDALVVL